MVLPPLPHILSPHGDLTVSSALLEPNQPPRKNTGEPTASQNSAVSMIFGEISPPNAVGMKFLPYLLNILLICEDPAAI
jgi:hypothetical protein